MKDGDAEDGKIKQEEAAAGINEEDYEDYNQLSADEEQGEESPPVAAEELESKKRRNANILHDKNENKNDGDNREEKGGEKRKEEGVGDDGEKKE